LILGYQKKGVGQGREPARLLKTRETVKPSEKVQGDPYAKRKS